MIKKMEERRIAKTTNVKEYRRLINQLRRETGRAKELAIHGRGMRGNNGPLEEWQISPHISKGTAIRRKN